MPGPLDPPKLTPEMEAQIRKMLDRENGVGMHPWRYWIRSHIIRYDGTGFISPFAVRMWFRDTEIVLDHIRDWRPKPKPKGDLAYGPWLRIRSGTPPIRWHIMIFLKGRRVMIWHSKKPWVSPITWKHKTWKEYLDEKGDPSAV